jgi:predicted nucleotidyltransferase
MKQAHPGVDESLLQEVVRRILSVRTPKAVILFGSTARGQSRPDSDLDLLIVESENPLPPHQRATAYRMGLAGIDRDVDLLVYTPDEIDEWAAVPNAFITTAMREGKVLYENRVGPSPRVAG